MAERERRKGEDENEDRANHAKPGEAPAEQPSPAIPATVAAGLEGRGAGPARAAAALNMQRTRGNKATRRLLDGGALATLQRQGHGGSGAHGTSGAAMSRAEFERRMNGLGVAVVRNGTYDEQRARLNSLNHDTRLGDHVDQSGWQPWNPGASSTVYNWIVATFTTFATRAGGLPEVREVVFYETDYHATSGAGGTVATPAGNVAAEYTGGSMAVYRAGVEGGGRVWATGRNPGPGATNQAAVSSGSQEAATTRTIAHEMGHGIQEAALTPPASGPAADPGLMRDYALAAGWYNGVLYDIGVPAVSTAITAGNTPPASNRITADSWNGGDLVEQPISRYMTSSAFEDFPEAVSAFVTEPALLQARSPHRFNFIQAHLATLTPHLRQPRPATP